MRQDVEQRKIHAPFALAAADHARSSSAALDALLAVAADATGSASAQGAGAVTALRGRSRLVHFLALITDGVVTSYFASRVRSTLTEAVLNNRVSCVIQSIIIRGSKEGNSSRRSPNKIEAMTSRIALSQLRGLAQPLYQN
jgi:hypothetical protein